MAALIPLTGEVLVNTGATSGQQTDPLVTALTDGRYVVLYRDEAQVRFFAQFYTSAGVAQGAPVVVNTSSGVRLSGEGLVALPGGGFAFAFNSAANGQTFARVVHADGALGQLTQISTTSGASDLVQLHALTSESVLAVFRAGSVIHTQTLTFNGAIGTDRQLNSQFSAGLEGSIANYAGGFVNTYINSAGVYMQRLANDGTPIDAVEKQIATNQGTVVFVSEAIGLTNGGYVIVWADGTNSGTSSSPIYHETFRAQFYDATGTASGGIATLFTVDASTAGEVQSAWTGIGTSDGGFVLGLTTQRPVDTSVPTGTAYTQSLTARTFSSQGQQTSNPVVIDSAVGVGETLDTERGNVQATRLADGSIVFTWAQTSTADTGDIVMRRYSFNVPTSPTGTAGDDSVVADGSGTLLNLSQGGHDTATGSAANEGFYFGAAFDSLDIIDAGGGTDQLGLRGDYSAGVTFGPSGLVGIEQLVPLSGSNTAFGGVATERFSYNLTAVDGNVLPGQYIALNANGLLVGENLTFNASAETNGAWLVYAGAGSDVLTGGQQADGFFFGTGRFNAGDRVDGQGGLDQVALQGDYSGANALTFGANQLVSVEAIVLLSGNDPRFGGSGTGYSYNLTLNDANAVAGASFTVSANQLAANESLTLNASAESDDAITVYGGAGADILFLGALGDTVFGGGGNDFIVGRGGADQLTGGSGADTFVYQTLSDSTVAARDHILDFASGDRMDFSGVDGNSVAAGVQAFSFIGTGQFTGVAGQLRAFNIDGFDWYVNGDSNGDRIADFSILVTVPDGHALTIADLNGVTQGPGGAAVMVPDNEPVALTLAAFAPDVMPTGMADWHALVTHAPEPLVPILTVA